MIRVQDQRVVDTFHASWNFYQGYNQSMVLRVQPIEVLIENTMLEHRYCHLDQRN